MIHDSTPIEELAAEWTALYNDPDITDRSKDWSINRDQMDALLWRMQRRCGEEHTLQYLQNAADTHKMIYGSARDPKILVEGSNLYTNFRSTYCG